MRAILVIIAIFVAMLIPIFIYSVGAYLITEIVCWLSGNSDCISKMVSHIT